MAERKLLWKNASEIGRTQAKVAEHKLKRQNTSKNGKMGLGSLWAWKTLGIHLRAGLVRPRTQLNILTAPQMKNRNPFWAADPIGDKVL